MEQAIEFSQYNDQVYLIKVYRLGEKQGFYYLNQDGVFFNQRYMVGEEKSNLEAPYDVVVVYKGKVKTMRSDDKFGIDSQN